MSAPGDSVASVNDSRVSSISSEIGQAGREHSPVPILQDCSDRINTFEHDFIHVAVKHRLGRYVLNDILSVFHKHKVGKFPHDFRAAVRTPRYIEVSTMCQGQYHHFGLVKGLIRVLKSIPLERDNSLRLQFNFDGLPLYKSSQAGFWPILCKCRVGKYSCKVFLVGLFFGVGKPSSVSEFLEKFIHELVSLNGYVRINDTDCSVVVDSIVCDAPARAYVKGIKYPGGHYACERCTVKGIHDRVHYGGVRYFENNSSERTNDGFRALVDRNHHRESCPLNVIDMDLVRDFPLDYMHLVLLGVVRRVIKMWFPDAKQKKHECFNVHAIRAGKIEVAINRIVRCGKSSPCEFQRRPRSFADLNYFKATEFRCIVLYLFPFVFFRLFVNPFVYDHFCLLVVSMRILCNENSQRSSVEFARRCLRKFVEDSEDIYGKSFYVYNVHCLLHLADDYERFGNLDSISCFPFESFMQKIKRYIKRPGGELAQVAKRVIEEDLWADEGQNTFDFVELADERFTGPTGGFQGENLRHYRKCSIFGKTIKVDSNDDAVRVKDSYGLVQNIFRCGDHVYLAVCMFTDYSEVFLYPCPSSDVGIVFASKISSEYSVMHIREAAKCFKLELKDDNMTFLAKMLHDCV